MVKTLFLLPGFLLYSIFMLIPIGISLYYSLTDWDGFSPRMNFVGISNYVRALSDPVFLRALYVTCFITVVSTICLNIIGIWFAILLNFKGKIMSLYRAVFFFPMVLSTVVVGFLWKTILNYNGILNQLLVMAGAPKLQFLGDPNLAILTITGVTIWQTLGFNIVLYLAGLQTIPQSLYESATIDGANKFQVFRNITWPMLAPAVTINTVLLVIFGMRTYDQVAVITDGGPAGSTQTIAFQITKEAFSANQMGYASSLAIDLLLLVALLSAILVVQLRRREEKIL